jgi:hypothetical protein
MPAVELASRRQKAVYWACTGHDGYGEPVLAAPIELDVRWVARQTEMVSADGNVVGLDATAVVDRDIPIDSILWLGTLATFYGVGSAGSPSGLMVVKAFNSALDIKARVSKRSVGMMRYKDRLPGH